MRLQEVKDLLFGFQRKYPLGICYFRIAFDSEGETYYQVAWNLNASPGHPGEAYPVEHDSQDFNEAIGRLWALVLDGKEG